MNHKTYGAGKAMCHTGHNLIFTTDSGIEVWAGGKNRLGGWHQMSPYAQVAIGPSETMSEGYGSSNVTTVPEGWTCEEHIATEEPPLMVSIDWPDFSTPNLPVEFWTSLCNDLITQEITSVSTQCAGGHGRTGVQLSILAYLLCPSKRDLWKDAHDLIEWVREQHCTHAVETSSQQKYVADACGIPEGKSTISVSTNFTFVGTESTHWKPKDSLSDMFGEEDSDEHEDNYCKQCTILFYDDEILIENQCPQCSGELGGESKAKDCPACGTKECIDEKDVCSDCGYDMYFEDEEEIETRYQCEECQSSYKDNMYVGESCTCIICQTKSMRNGVLSIKKGKVSLKCSRCKKKKPTKYIKNIDDEVLCYGCY